jgi:hypothetical protein
VTEGRLLRSPCTFSIFSNSKIARVKKRCNAEPSAGTDPSRCVWTTVLGILDRDPDIKKSAAAPIVVSRDCARDPH